MSVSPHAGIIDFGTFTPPTNSVDGIQGEVPQPLAGQQNYILSGNGWVALSSLGTLIYKGTWDAATNTPTLQSSVGTQGDYYVVSVAGNTNLNGITTWTVGDWAIFNGAVWQKLEGGSTVDITGGQINNTTIGNITPAAGTFTTVGVSAPTTNATLTNSTGINAWAYSGKSFSVSAQETSPLGVFFRPNGTKMYVTGSSGDDVNEYTLGTAWDVSTASFTAVSTGITQDTGPNDLSFKDDGLTLFVLGGTNDTVYQYTLSVAWDITTATYASKSFSVTTQETAPTGMWMKPDGTTMYIVGTTADAVFQYTLSTPWDISTASYASKTYSFSAQETTAAGIALSNDGTKMWITGTVGDDIWEYTLGTAWDISTATPVNNFYVGFQETNPNGIYVDSTAANRVYIVGTTNDTVYQYNTSTNSVTVTTDKLFVDGVTSINGNFVAGANAYIDGTLSVLNSVSFGTTSVSGTLTGSSAVNFSTNTGNLSLGTAQTTGLWTGGGTTQTGAITLGQSTAAQTLNLGTGATTSGTTKTVNIGTAGVSGSTTNINIGSAVSGATGTITFSSGGTQMAVTNTASAVNYVQVTGGATGNAVNISALGSDNPITLNLNARGSAGVINIGNSGAAPFLQVQGTSGQTVANYLNIQATQAGVAPRLSVAGSDTNIAATFQSKGTGAINLVPGSSGVNISNGSTVTAITRTAGGTGYTSFPTVTISQPTTAGGVQATVTLPFMFVTGGTVVSGGTGYTVGDTLTMVGGTPQSVAGTLTVSSVSGGVITGLTGGNFANYSVLPTNPISMTGGTGSGASINVTYGVSSTNFAVNNAGSGYVEQPTVTFSGGGGSGAAAYATVGSGTTIRSLGSTVSVFTPGGEAVRVAENAGTTTTGMLVTTGTSSQNTIYVSPYGSGSGSNLYFFSKGTGQIGFGTNTNNNALGTEQLRVSHTASAVNYVQVTGAATGNSPIISAQGSDSNIQLQLQSKGTGLIRFTTGAGLQAYVTDTASPVNQLVFTGAAASAAPRLSVAGTDTNIDLALTPKGTGLVRFGTRTATSDVAITGYLEIKDSGGTTRKLAIID